MGSCENSLEVPESLHSATNERHSCLIKISDSQQLPYLEGGSNKADIDVGPTCALDQCLQLCKNDNSGCVSSGDFQELLSVERGIGSACESQIAVGLGPGNLSDDEFRVIGDHSEKGKNEIFDCNAETDGLCMKKLEPSDENNGLVNSLEDCVQSLDIGIVMPVSGSLRNRNQQDAQNEDRSGDVQGDMEEKIDALAATDSNKCDQMMPSLDSGKPAELRLINALLNNEVDQDNQDGSASLVRVMAVQEDRLPGVGTDDHNPMQLLLDPKTLSELIPTLDSSSNCVQQGDQKDDLIIDSSSAKEITVVTEESKFLRVTEAATCGQLLCDPGFYKSLELMPVFGSLEKIVKQDEQKDDRPVNLSCENRVEIVAKNKILPSLNDESCVQSDTVSDFPKDCCQQSDLEAKTVSSVAFVSAVDGKIDALAAMESDLCIQQPLHSFEMLKKISITGFTVSSCERQDYGKNGKDVNYLAAVRAPTDILKNSDVKNYLEACSAQACQKTFESLCMDNPLGNCSQENEQRDGNSINDPFEESSPDVVEEKSDITTEIKVEVHDQKFYMEAGAYDLKKDSPEIAPNSPQSCQPRNVTENGASRGLDASHPFGKAVLGAMSISTAAECYEQKDNEGEDLARNDFPPKTGCPNIGSSSSRRSSRICKSCHKTETKKAARKHKNKAKVQDLQIFKAERRKRSCFSKPARSSNWGSLVNIAQFFEQSNGLVLKEIVPSKTKVGRERRKQNKSRVTGSSQRSSGKEHAPMRGIRLKVKLGNKFCRDNLNLMVSEVLDTPGLGGVSDFETKSYTGTGFQIPSFANGIEDKMGEDETEEQLQCLENKLEEAKIHSDASILDLHVADKDLEGTVISQKSTGETAGGCLGLPSHVEVEESGSETEKRHTDPGTSPDSEVINLVPENQNNTRCQEDFPDAILTPLEVFVAPGVVSGSKKGKKDIVLHVSGCFQEDISPQVACADKVKTRKKQGRKESKGDGFFTIETLISSTSANASSNSSSNKESSEEVLHLSSNNELLVLREALPAEIKAENKVYSGLDAGLKLSETQYSNHLLPSTKSKGSRLPKKLGRANKGRSKVSDKARSKRENGCRRRGNEQKSKNKNKVKEKSDCGDVNFKAEDVPETGNCVLDDTGKTYHGGNIASIDAPNMASSKIVEQHIPVDNAWVRCDDCHKWRRIPVALVDFIGQTNCQWICKDNMDKAFADCSIPQEKSNAEINAELGLSDADEDAYDVPSKSKGLECRRTVSKEHEFTRISANQFLHRSRKTQTIDEIMVCNCKLPLDGSLGCGDECLNRMLNIECVQGTCPCGDHCSNQQFQKRIYAKMKWDRCGKKGFGLRMEEDISKGQFLVEYVGEVLDMHTYEARQREYAFKGHKHFYFMTLNGSEVIDACAKGNLGRFINHSCDPNCRTEKWVVNGEICIGLFALRDMNKGEEITFDYNYVRVVGAAAKKCYCGSSHCRGYIGGDPTSTEVIDQVDSDEEFLEPVMLEDGEAGLSFKNGVSRTSSFNDVEQQIAESISKDKNKMAHSKTADVKFEVASEIEDSTNQSVSTISQLHSSLELDDFKGSLPSACQPLEIAENSDDISSKSVAKHEISMEDVQRPETSSKSSDGSVTKLKSKSSIVEQKRVFVKSRFFIKTSHESSCSKKGKLTTDSLNIDRVPTLANKSQVLSIKPKKLLNGTSNGRFEAVEEKLNELLDVDGGISKRKEAAKCYLKFLLLTAASGASGNGEAIQSNRDLSMILDALLKTKSRAVLIDIINKNGLRMLHNMMKQYRRDFKKTPILRKLLKVLEYLAFREILTQDHITGGPPCPGMESFTDSILSLTEHDDKQVHQIARNFRDKWIPRHCRRFSNMDRNDGKMDFHKGSISNRVLASHNHLRDLPVGPIEAIDCAMQPKPATASVDTAVNEGSSPLCVSGGTKNRKRKSRWDQPAKEKLSSNSPQHNEQKIQSALQQQSEYNPPPVTGKEVSDHEEKGTRQNYCPRCAHNYCRQDETSFADNGRQNNQSDVPPGFSSPINPTLFSSSQQSSLMFPVGMVVGCPQKKFISRLSVSYGIPMPIVQQFGSPQDGTTESWDIAPGMPFHPFPPLPPFPHHNKESRVAPAASSAVNPTVINETAEEGQPLRNDPATCDPNENNPSTTGSSQPTIDVPGENGQQSFKRARASHDLGRRYFRQQKWNKVPPPWVRNRDGWGYLGNNSRGGICNNDVGSVTYEHRNSYCSQDLSCRVDKAGNCINQQNSTLN